MRHCRAAYVSLSPVAVIQDSWSGGDSSTSLRGGNNLMMGGSQFSSCAAGAHIHPRNHNLPSFLDEDYSYGCWVMSASVL